MGRGRSEVSGGHGGGYGRPQGDSLSQSHLHTCAWEVGELLKKKDERGDRREPEVETWTEEVVKAKGNADCSVRDVPVARPHQHCAGSEVSLSPLAVAICLLHL